MVGTIYLIYMSKHAEKNLLMLVVEKLSSIPINRWCVTFFYPLEGENGI